jgi:hypothetical protein
MCLPLLAGEKICPSLIINDYFKFLPISQPFVLDLLL